MTWKLNQKKKVVHLTFDDGPTPEVTLWVLNELKKYGFKATFFCIGKNILSYPDIFIQIIEEGHQVANHTQNHENGWNTKTEDYLQSILACERTITALRKSQETKFFRPPYGKITFKQSKLILDLGYKIIMWSNITGDYKQNISAENCYKNSIKSLQNGDIIVFHDSYKAFENLKKTLPKTLENLQKRGFKSEVILKSAE